MLLIVATSPALVAHYLTLVKSHCPLPSSGVHSLPTTFPLRPRRGLTSTTTASAVAAPIFRGSVLDPPYRPPSTPLYDSRLEEYSSSRRSQYRGVSPLPPTAAFGKDISRPSSTTLPSTGSLFLHQPQFHTRSASVGLGEREYHSEPRPALPALSSLTSLAATPPSLRYDLS